MKVCVFAPYGRHEVTAAAVRVADLSVAWGNETRFVASSVREEGIHDLWDGLVVGIRNRRRSYLVCKGADRCVWFVNDRRLRKDVELVAPKAYHVWVPRLHDGAVTVEDVKRHALVVCPGKHVSESIRINACGGEFPVQATWTRFDGGMPFVRRRPRSGSPPSLLVLCDKSTVCGTHGYQILAALQKILAASDRLILTVLSASSWPRPLRSHLRKLAEQFQSRVRIGVQRSWLGQAMEMHYHDAAFIPSPKADFGINATRCLACSVPVVAYDVAPFNEVVTPGKNGWLVPTLCKEAASGAKEAFPRTSDIVAVLQTAIEAGAADDLRSNPWYVQDRSSEFEKAWAQVLS